MKLFSLIQYVKVLSNLKNHELPPLSPHPSQSPDMNIYLHFHIHKQTSIDIIICCLYRETILKSVFYSNIITKSTFSLLGSTKQ